MCGVAVAELGFSVGRYPKRRESRRNKRTLGWRQIAGFRSPFLVINSARKSAKVFLIRMLDMPAFNDSIRVSPNDTEAAQCGGTRPAGSVMLVFCFEKARSMLSSPLTPRQAAILEFVRSFIASHGYPPTIREVGQQFGISSPNGVVCHLRSLELKGAIRRAPNRSRAIVPTAA